MAKQIVAKYKNPLVRRVITKEDQNRLIGAKVAKEDLVWEENSPFPVNVTDVDPAVLEYLNKDSDFQVKELDVEDESEAAPVEQDTDETPETAPRTTDQAESVETTRPAPTRNSRRTS